MKHLLFVIDSLGCGGAEKSLISLLPLIDYNRCEVDLLIRSRGGVFEKFVPEQVHIISHSFYGRSIADHCTAKLHRLWFSAQLRFHKSRHGAETHWQTMVDCIKPMEKHYDVAIAYQQGFPTFFVATKVAAIQKIAWINVDIFKAGYDTNFCKPFYRHMDSVVAVSEQLYDMLNTNLDFLKGKLSCVYDIVNSSLIQHMANETVPEEAVMRQQVSLVTTGRLAPPKNHKMALEAARILKEHNIRFKWYFVGDGSLMGELKTIIEKYGLRDYVILLGLRENPYPYMRLSDIYVQTSSFEGFGLTIAEAKILKRPIVSTNFSVIYDQLENNVNGIIVDMSPSAIATAIEYLIGHPDVRARMIRNLELESNTTYQTEIKKFNQLIGLA